jgi:hypothetical protein
MRRGGRKNDGAFSLLLFFHHKPETGYALFSAIACAPSVLASIFPLASSSGNRGRAAGEPAPYGAAWIDSPSIPKFSHDSLRLLADALLAQSCKMGCYWSLSIFPRSRIRSKFMPGRSWLTGILPVVSFIK